MIPVVGFGAGGHATVVIEILRSMREYEIVGLLDTRVERARVFSAWKCSATIR